MKRRTLSWPLLGTALGLLAAVLIVGFTGEDSIGYARWVQTSAAAQALLGIAVALSVLALGRARPGAAWLPVVLVLAVVFRVSLVDAPYALSEDAARYHWDGKVLASGVNPYLFVPEAPEVAHLRVHELDEGISSRSNRTLTVYPPLAQLFFAAAYLVTPGSLHGLNLWWLLAELATWLLLARELARRKLPAGWLLFAAWSPLLIFQGYLPGHVDLLLLPFVVLFVRAVSEERAERAGLWMGLLCLIKPLPIVLLPAAWKELGTRRTLQLVAVMALTMAVFYLPFLSAGGNLFSSTWLMAREWSFNSSLAALLEEWLPQGAAHLVAGLGMLLAVLAAVHWSRDFLGRCLLTAGVFVVFSTTLFPWYLAWIFPLLVLRPDPALVVLGCLAPLADLVMPDYVAAGIWSQPTWTLIVEYVAFYALLLVGYLRGWGMFAGLRPVSSRHLALNT